jgi:hypothetical protein
VILVFPPSPVVKKFPSQGKKIPPPQWSKKLGGEGIETCVYVIEKGRIGNKKGQDFKEGKIDVDKF